ncbi:hypothetical protein [Ruminococcus sp. HUN007]|uniref:hypothetical protein n=1 Tax=Ruminococcus sp. HUN007 TaxID=1514668 RepID=UPI0005D296D8|nr:hypothetical protein [Ruminococcus sp. HUN007]
MKKHYGTIILSALMAGTVFTGCGPVENSELPAAEPTVTEEVTEEAAAETEEITEAETEAETEPEETEPAVTESASKRDSNLAAIDGTKEIVFGEYADYGGTHTFNELFEEGMASVSDSADGLAMCIRHVGDAAGSQYYEAAYTSDFGKTWKQAESTTDIIRITNGVITFHVLDSGDILLFRYHGPDRIGQPAVQLFTQSADDPKPKISQTIFLDDYLPAPEYDAENFEASYVEGNILHVDCLNKEKEITDSFDVPLDELEFEF